MPQGHHWDQARVDSITADIPFVCDCDRADSSTVVPLSSFEIYVIMKMPNETD